MSASTCPHPNELYELLVGRLPTQSVEQIVAHLGDCANCRSLLETFVDADDTLVAQLRLPVPEDPYVDEPQRRAFLARTRSLAGSLLDSAGSATEQPAIATAFPRQFREYELLGRLGAGGMGTVFRARHIRLDRMVAIKVLSADRVGNRRAVARFEREMRAVGRLNHRNIVQARDAGEIDGAPFLVMEYVAGCDLAELSRCLGPLAVADACELIRQAATGLEYAHRQGLVHRDVKPSNLMLADGGELKILDLGLALFRDRWAESGEELTGSGMMMGTLDYMAPEQGTDSHEVDARADVYGLGATLYKLLCGVPPFFSGDYDSPVEKLVALSSRRAPSIAQRHPGLPPGLIVAVDRMLARDPAERFPTAAEVAEALEAYCAGCSLPSLLQRAAAASDRADESAEAGAVSAETGPSGQADTKSTAKRLAEMPRSGQRFSRRIAVAAAGVFVALCLLQAVVRNSESGRDIHPALPPEGSVEAVDLTHRTPDVESAASPAAAAAATSGEPAAAASRASDAAAALLARTELTPRVRTAMLTVLRQHPGETRWSGRDRGTLFAVAAKALPESAIRQRAATALLELVHMQAVHELLKAKSLLDAYAATGLTDATTLRQAVVEAAGVLHVSGNVRGIAFRAAVSGDFAVAYVIAEESSLSAYLLQPPELNKVRAAYRDVMHRQARALMEQANWSDALLLWQHLHQRELVSPQLYLDAARCFQELKRPDDTLRVLSEALSAFADEGTAEFFERAGDIALSLPDEAAQSLAARAYTVASEKLLETVSSGTPGTPGPALRE